LGGHPTEAIAAGRAMMARIQAKYGSEHPLMAGPRTWLSLALQLAGDLSGALAERRLASHLFARGPAGAPSRRPWGRGYELELELEQGIVPADAADAIRALANRGTTPPLANPDGTSTVR